MFSQITVSGEDALTFLQGQLTQDLSRVTGDHSPLAAWCTPQGRVVATMRLLLLPVGIGLVMPTAIINDVIAGLSIYKLRAKVVLESCTESCQSLAIANSTDIELLKARRLMPRAETNASCHSDGIHVVSPSATQDFVEIYGDKKALASAGLDFVKPLSSADWRASRIIIGITDIVPATSGKFTPHMLNLDRLDALSFDKGCYTGQEIVARTQHLGSVKRRATRFHSVAPVAIGDSVSLDGTTVGEIVAAAEHDVLAVLPIALQNINLHAANVALQPS